MYSKVPDKRTGLNKSTVLVGKFVKINKHTGAKSLAQKYNFL